MIDCRYCRGDEKYISGETIRTDELKKAEDYKEPEKYRDWLGMYILKCPCEERASLMIENTNGTRYIEIDYCPWCGRKF